MSDIVRKDGGVEITRSVQPRVRASGGGIEIRRAGKPVFGADIGMNVAYLLIDCSGSMAGEKLEQAKRGGVDFARGAVAKGYMLGLITFDDEAHLRCEPAGSAALENALSEIRVAGSTNMTAALSLATEKLRNKGANRAVILITDGAPDDAPSAIAAAEEMKKNGVDIITIGTFDANADFLARLATRSDLSMTVRDDELQLGISSASALLPEGPR